MAAASTASLGSMYFVAATPSLLSTHTESPLSQLPLPATTVALPLKICGHMEKLLEGFTLGVAGGNAEGYRAKGSRPTFKTWHFASDCTWTSSSIELAGLHVPKMAACLTGTKIAALHACMTGRSASM